MKTLFFESFYTMCTCFTLFCCNATSEVIESTILTSNYVNQNANHLANYSDDNIQGYNEFVTNTTKTLWQVDQKTNKIKIGIGHCNQLVQDKFTKQIESIEFKSLYLKNNIVQHQSDSKNNWELFKKSYMNQLTELANLITDIENNFEEYNSK